MFQLFTRTLGDHPFKARSTARDADTDRSRIAAIADSIDDALAAAEAEHAGLNKRVTDVVARAALTLGTDSDEYIERDPLDNHHQNLFSTEIGNGERRLRELENNIGHFKFLKAVLATRFPDFESRESRK